MKRQTGQPAPPTEDRGAADLSDLDDRVLKAFHADPDSPRHVIDLAKAAGIDFATALKAVLDLASRGVLEIRKRDNLAGDHLVSLTTPPR